LNYPIPFPEQRKTAKFIDNVRLNKFIVEFEQMLNVAMAKHGASSDKDLLVRVNGKAFGVKGHANHPCTVWVGKNRSNFLHMVRSLLEFYNEHIRRGGKGHANVKENILRATRFAKNIPQGKLTPFANCAAHSDLGISFKHLTDTHKAYKLYIQERWKIDKKEPKWGY
jgi:hypothetical protein